MDDLGNQRLHLPEGARNIIQGLVAEEILEQMLQTALNKPISTQEPIIEEEAIVDLISKFPAACRRTYKFQLFEGKSFEMYPLHWIMFRLPSLDFVLQVYSAFPEAVNMSTLNGPCPLNLACFYGASLEVIEYLHFLDPLAIQRPESFWNNQGFYSLHWACASIRIPDLEVIMFLMEHFPGAARKISVSNTNSMFPLHLAVTKGAPASVLKLLSESFPQALETTAANMTPLLYACHNRWCELSTIKFLAEAVQDIIPEGENLDPVSIAIMHQSPDVIAYLEGILPSPSSERWIEMACRHNRVDVVEYCEKKFRDSFMSRSRRRSPRSALHWACMDERTNEVEDKFAKIKLIVELNPRLLFARDIRNQKPVETAYENHLPENVIEFLRKQERVHSPY